MLSKDSWLRFPSHLTPPALRSLSLVFILEELAIQLEKVHSLQKSIPLFSKELFSFFCLSHSYPQMGMCPDKLCFYCDILLQASKIRDRSLRNELDEMRIFILQCRSSLYFSKSVDSEFLALFSKIYQKLCAVFTALIPFLREAKTDENVLLALVEKREILNCHLGPQAIEKIFQDFFPKGHVHLKALISEGLMRRGFISFFEEKEHLIDEIEWRNACHPITD